MKILIVDDEFEIRETIKGMLQDVVQEIIYASDAVTAMLTLKDHEDVHTIITDYRMPGLGGKDWIEMVRYYHPKKNLVVMTGYEVAKDKLSSSVKIIMKPFTKYQLLEAIGV
jgi:two-component system NtrC family sensor kinase